jgi:hypothetical protein
MHLEVVSIGPVNATTQKLRILLPAYEWIHDNHYIEKNKDLSEPLEAIEILLAKDATVIESLEIEMSPLVSDSGCD